MPGATVTSSPSASPPPPHADAVAPARFRRPPFGVIAIAALLLLKALVFGLFAFAEFQAPERFLMAARTGDMTAVILTPIAVMQLFLAVGLLFARRWAWLLTMVTVGLGMGVALYMYFVQGEPVPLSAGVLNIMIVFYLNQRDVRGYFGEAPAAGS